MDELHDQGMGIRVWAAKMKGRGDVPVDNPVATSSVRLNPDMKTPFHVVLQFDKQHLLLDPLEYGVEPLLSFQVTE